MVNFKALNSSVRAPVQMSTDYGSVFFSSFSSTNLIVWYQVKSFLQSFNFTLHRFRFILPTFNTVICTKEICNLQRMKGRMREVPYYFPRENKHVVIFLFFFFLNLVRSSLKPLNTKIQFLCKVVELQTQFCLPKFFLITPREPPQNRAPK